MPTRILEPPPTKTGHPLWHDPPVIEWEERNHVLLTVHFESASIEARDVAMLLNGLESLLNESAREVLQEHGVSREQWPEADLVQVEIIEASISSFTSVLKITTDKVNALIKH